MATKNPISAKRRAAMYLILVLALAAAAAILIVAIMLANRDTTPVGPIPPEPPVVQIDVPVSGSYEVEKVFAHDKLLYSTTLNLWMTHSGVDLKAAEGASVVAVMDGVIESVGNSALDGGYVTITHENGMTSIYKSLAIREEGDETAPKKGDEVKRGDVIGTVSDTMLIEIAQGPHLHFELKQEGKNINPASVIEDLIVTA